MTTSFGTVEAEAEISFAAVPSAVPQARHFTVRVLRDWRLDHLAEVTELLTSELVTNAIETANLTASNGGDQVRLRLALHADRIFLIVWDSDANPPVMRDAPTDAESGRGLLLVEALSQRWGHRPSQRGGKIVWCEIRVADRELGAALPVRIPSLIPPGDINIKNVDAATLQRFVDGLKALV